MAPLLVACEQEHVEVVTVLLEAGANPNHASEDYHVSPLDTAVALEHGALIKLLESYGAHRGYRG